MTDLSRRELVAQLGAAALGPHIGPGRRAPLSARLLPVPGKAVGDVAHVDDPFLTDCVVLRLE